MFGSGFKIKYSVGKRTMTEKQNYEWGREQFDGHKNSTEKIHFLQSTHENKIQKMKFRILSWQENTLGL